ncbi:MAG: hypothetical protein AAF841_06830 [Pseudomonadota bacterium]
MPVEDKVEIENVNTPDHITRVDRAKYEAMRAAYLAALPEDAPGMTAAEAKAALLETLDERFFPGGAKAGWWMKAVQLDLEAKGIVTRAATKPLRFHKSRAS